MELRYSMFEELFGGEKRIDNIIKGVENKCIPLNLACKQNPQRRWGIYFENKDAGVNVLLDPISLVNSIFKDQRLWLKGESIANYVSGKYIIDTHNNGISFEWIMAMTDAPLAVISFFTYKEYISKIRNAIDHLLQKIKEGEPVAYYKKDVNFENLTLCSLQLELECTLPTHRFLKSQDIKVDNFSLIPKGERGIYNLSLSQRGIELCIEEFGVDFEGLKHALELYLFSNKTTLSYEFECDPVDIILSKHRFCKATREIGTGTAFDYDHLTLVEIHSDLERMPILKGYCRTLEVVRQLYEGFLYLAYRCFAGLAYPHESELRLYNEFKSPMIEAYLKEDKRKQENKIEITKLWIIDPEFDVCISEITDSQIPFEVIDDTFEELKDNEGKPVTIPGFSKWAAEICPIIIKAETGEPYEFDWEVYHKRGLALARELRKVLPANIDLWYRAPFEDNSGILPHPILIIK